MRDPVHGRYTTYRNGCRCVPCTAAHSARQAVENGRRYALPAANGGIAPVAVHNRATYVNWGCSCENCASASARHGAEYRARKASAS